MPIDHRILTCSAFVGQPLDDRRFDLHGSGFFVFLQLDDKSFTYFVTAHHVVNEMWDDPSAPWPPPGKAFVRINRTGGRTPFLLETDRSEWLYHRDRHMVDICAFAVDEEKYDFHREFDVGILNIENLTVDGVPPFTPRYTLMLGDAVFITGAFSGHFGETKNVPIVRQGNIAAMLDGPLENGSPTRPTYLVETRSLGGISGSPIFFDPNSRHGRSGMGFGPVTVTDSTTGQTSPATTIFPYRLVGMVLSMFRIDDVDSVVTDVRQRRPDADFNTGISVAMPVSQIIDFLKSPEVSAVRT